MDMSEKLPRCMAHRFDFLLSLLDISRNATNLQNFISWKQKCFITLTDSFASWAWKDVKYYRLGALTLSILFETWLWLQTRRMKHKCLSVFCNEEGSNLCCLFSHVWTRNTVLANSTQLTVNRWGRDQKHTLWFSDTALVKHCQIFQGVKALQDLECGSFREISGTWTSYFLSITLRLSTEPLFSVYS